jgi:protein-disulfide isomerase
VLKEFPVLGPGSREAAKVSIAVRMQDKSGKKYLEFHQKLLGGRSADRARALAAARDAGVDMARLEKDLATPEVDASIDEVMHLAEALGINGTPTYVVGQSVVPGAIGAAALRQQIAAARKNK